MLTSAKATATTETEKDRQIERERDSQRERQTDRQRYTTLGRNLKVDKPSSGNQLLTSASGTTNRIGVQIGRERYT